MNQPVDSQLFSFRLHGNGVSPETVRAREVGKLITQLEHAFQYYLEAKQRNADSDFFLSLVEVKDASLGLGFIPSQVKSFMAAFIAITTSIQSGDYSAIPSKTIQEIQEIQKFIRIRDCVGDFVYQEEAFASIRPDTQISVPTSAWIRGETILYGEIKRVGGSDPSARVELDTGNIITCNVSRTIAKELGAKLYGQVALKGYASWSAIDNELLDFTIEKVIQYSPPRTNREAFAGLRRLLGPHWDGVDDIEDALLSSDTPIE